VARGNSALAGVRVVQEVDRWSVNAEGQVNGLGGNRVLNTALAIGGGIRFLSERLQVQGTLPLVYQYRALGGYEETGAGPGDAELNLRFAALQDDTEGISETGSWFPFVEPFVGVRFPSGRPPGRSERVTQADVTGTGDWQVATGVRLSRFVTEADVVFSSGGWGHAFPRTVQRGGESLLFHRGGEVSVSLGYLRFLSLFWALGGSASYRFVTRAREDGEAIAGTGTRQLTIGAQISHFLSWPSWQITLGVAMDPPIDRVSAGLPFIGVGGSLSLQRHFGTKNEYQ
jgi:hypothetical protein